MTSKLLSSHGHRVLEADGPDAAREAFGRQGEEVDLLLSDVALGATQDGPGLARELRDAA